MLLILAILCYCVALGECAGVDSVDVSCSPGNWTTWDNIPGPAEGYTANRLQSYPVSSGAVSLRMSTPAYYARVHLSERPDASSNRYSITIYPESNSLIWKNYELINSTLANVTELSREGTFGFWVSWKCGTLSVGRDGEDVPFITGTDPAPHSVHYLTLHQKERNNEPWRVKGLDYTEIASASSPVTNNY